MQRSDGISHNSRIHFRILPKRGPIVSQKGPDRIPRRRPPAAATKFGGWRGLRPCPPLCGLLSLGLPMLRVHVFGLPWHIFLIEIPCVTVGPFWDPIWPLLGSYRAPFRILQANLRAGCEKIYDNYVKYRPISTSTRKLSLIIITIVKLRVSLAEIIKSY